MRSLIKYSTMCDFLLVPTEEENLSKCGPASATADRFLHNVPGYGTRGWWCAESSPPPPLLRFSLACACKHPPPPCHLLACPGSRIEYFIFSLIVQMQGRDEVPIYAIQRGGELNQYPEVILYRLADMPSGGALANPNDKEHVKSVEDTVVEVYGKVMVEQICKKAGRGAGRGAKPNDSNKAVDIQGKMIREVHVDSIIAAVEKYEVANLNLSLNQLGDHGVEKMAAFLKTNTTLTSLWWAWPPRTHTLPRPLSAPLALHNVQAPRERIWQ